MLHSLRTLLIRQITPKFPYSLGHTFNSFCTVKYPPAIQQLLQINNAQQLSHSLIQIYKLNDVNKRVGIKIIMQRVKERIFPQSVLVDQKFQVHIKRFHDLHIEVFLFRIEEHLKELEKLIKNNNQVGKKVVVKDINTCFTIIFEILKKVPRNEVSKLQIRVYKQFASYHQKYLMRLIEHKRYKQILSKSLEFYKAALSKITAFIEKEEAKSAEQQNSLQEKTDEIDLDKLTYQQAQQIQKTIQYKLHKYSQEYCQILYQTMAVQNYITDPRIKQTPRPRSKLSLPFKYHQGLFDLIPLFQTAISLLNKAHESNSKYYYKIKKTLLQLVYHKNLSENKGDETFYKTCTIQFLKKMNHLSKQIIQNLKLLPAEKDYIDLCQDMTLVLLGIKTYKISFLTKDTKKFQKLLVKQIQSILKIIQEKNVKKLILANFTIAVSNTMNINLQKYFGKAPRPVIHHRRSKPKINENDEEENEEDEEDEKGEEDEEDEVEEGEEFPSEKLKDKNSPQQGGKGTV